MEKLNMELPAGVAAYRLPDDRVFRIHVEIKTKDFSQRPDFLEIESRGYQITDKGDLMVDENLEPIMLAPQRARIPTAGVLAGTESLRPGWVRRDTDPGQIDEIKKTTRTLKSLPKTGKQDDSVFVGDELYFYVDGIYEGIRRARVAEVSAQVAEEPMDLSAFSL